MAADCTLSAPKFVVSVQATSTPEQTVGTQAHSKTSKKKSSKRKDNTVRSTASHALQGGSTAATQVLSSSITLLILPEERGLQ